MKMKSIRSMIVLGLILSSCGSSGESVSLDILPVSLNYENTYLNLKGEPLFDTEIVGGGYFSNGRAVFYDEEGYGFIDGKGKVVIKPQFKRANGFSDGIAWVTLENSHPQAINTSGKVLFTLEKADRVWNFHDGVSVFETYNEAGESQYGCVNKSGKVVIEPKPYEITFFSEGKATIRNSDYKWGYIDKKGKTIINCQFDEAKPFKENGLACVKFGDKWGVINEKGQYVINPIFEDIHPDGDMFLCKTDKKVGWCDKKGKTIINPQFTNAYPFGENDLAPVVDDKKWGYINRKGTLEIPYQFDYASCFIMNKTGIVSLNKKIGLINKDGQYIVNPQYDGVSTQYLSYLGSGELNDYLKSIYLDKDGIIVEMKSLIKSEEIWSLPFDYNMKDINRKYGLTEKAFPKKNSTVQIDQKKLSRNADLSFHINGMPWTKSGQGWFANYVFNPSYQPESYSIIVELSFYIKDQVEPLTRELFNAFCEEGGLKEPIRPGQVMINRVHDYDLRFSYNNLKITINVEPVRL